MDTNILGPEIKPKKGHIVSAYVWANLFFLGRAIEAAASIDPEIGDEVRALGQDFLLKMTVWPSGPSMYIRKRGETGLKYLGWKDKGIRPTLTMSIKGMAAAFLLFTFQESTAISTARNRLIVEGSLQDASAFVRILNKVEIYLLPRPIAGLAVKRYPSWARMGPIKRHINRFRVYFHILKNLLR